MSELQQKLELWKTYLREDGYEESENLDTMTAEEIRDLVRRVAIEMKRRQMVYSPNTEEYKSLGKKRGLTEQIKAMLDDRDMENSGLSLFAPKKENEEELKAAVEAEIKRQEEQQKELKEQEKRRQEQILLNFKEKVTLYREEKTKGDVKKMQRLYKDMVRLTKQSPDVLTEFAMFENQECFNKRRFLHLLLQAAEKGSGKGAYTLAMYTVDEATEINRLRAERYMDLAVKNGHMPSILQKAMELSGGSGRLYYYFAPANYEEAFLLFQKYYANNDYYDMTNSQCRKALYSYYYSGAMCGYDLNENALQISWRELLRVEGITAEEAQALRDAILKGKNDYESLIRLYMEKDTVEGIRKVEEYFFDEQVIAKKEFRKKLEDKLLSMTEDENCSSAVRAELNDWYGSRYEKGIEKVKDDITAYKFYSKAGTISRHKEFRNRVLGSLTSNQKIAFLKSLLDEGCYDVAKEIAEVYEANKLYDDAKSYYQTGERRASNYAVRRLCAEGYIRCNEKVMKQHEMETEASISYDQCMSGTLGKKKIGFSRLLELASNGNTYAALRAAQVAETDTHLRENKENIPSDEKIFSLYASAARAGEYEAIARMAEIYERGELGQRVDKEQARSWRLKL